MRACVVGSGPAGFYTAKHLLKAGLAVDLLESLPCPFGLVRFGVAPDHPEVKTVENDFTKIAADPRLRFFGHCHVGQDVSVKELLQMYNAVVLAVGASGERTMGLANEDALVHGARAFVAWYNGHPRLHASTAHALDSAVRTAKHVVVVGNGNVALDCARVLVAPLDELRKTDIAPRALDALAQRRVEKVSVCGRRNAAHAAFTIKEVRELTKMAGVSVEITPDELELSAAETAEVEGNRAKKRLYGLLKDTSAVPLSPGSKVVALRFGLAPRALLAEHSALSGLEMAKTRTVGGAAETTGATETLPCELALRSIGYKGEALGAHVPFDSVRGVVPTEGGGRVVGVRGLYASGWIKRGATGILGTNIPDARETADAVLADLDKNGVARDGAADDAASVGKDLADVLRARSVRFVDWQAWERLNAFEQAEGAKTGRPRVKLESEAAMLERCFATGYK